MWRQPCYGHLCCEPNVIHLHNLLKPQRSLCSTLQSYCVTMWLFQLMDFWPRCPFLDLFVWCGTFFWICRDYLASVARSMPFTDCCMRCLQKSMESFVDLSISMIAGSLVQTLARWSALIWLSSWWLSRWWCGFRSSNPLRTENHIQFWARRGRLFVECGRVVEHETKDHLHVWVNPHVSFGVLGIGQSNRGIIARKREHANWMHCQWKRNQLACYEWMRHTKCSIWIFVPFSFLVAPSRFELKLFEADLIAFVRPRLSSPLVKQWLYNHGLSTQQKMYGKKFRSTLQFKSAHVERCTSIARQRHITVPGRKLVFCEKCAFCISRLVLVSRALVHVPLTAEKLTDIKSLRALCVRLSERKPEGDSGVKDVRRAAAHTVHKLSRLFLLIRTAVIHDVKDLATQRSHVGCGLYSVPRSASCVVSLPYVLGFDGIVAFCEHFAPILRSSMRKGMAIMMKPEYVRNMSIKRFLSNSKMWCAQVTRSEKFSCSYSMLRPLLYDDIRACEDGHIFDRLHHTRVLGRSNDRGSAETVAYPDSDWCISVLERAYVILEKHGVAISVAMKNIHVWWLFVTRGNKFTVTWKHFIELVEGMENFVPSQNDCLWCWQKEITHGNHMPRDMEGMFHQHGFEQGECHLRYPTFWSWGLCRCLSYTYVLLWLRTVSSTSMWHAGCDAKTQWSYR